MSAFRLRIDVDPLGAVSITATATAEQLEALSDRQHTDFSIARALLEAAARPDNAFFPEEGPIQRALEISAAHELAEVAAA